MQEAVGNAGKDNDKKLFLVKREEISIIQGLSAIKLLMQKKEQNTNKQ